MNRIRSSIYQRIAVATSIAGLAHLNIKHLAPEKVECSPYFNGSPVAASLLMRQASVIFDEQFPGLELSAVFLSPELVAFQETADLKRREERNKVGSIPTNIPGEETEYNNRTKKLVLAQFSYDEHGALKWLNWPSGASCSAPVMPRYSEQEEQEFGRNGIYKSPVGRLVMYGKCQYGCAQVSLTSMKLEKLDGSLVWEWNQESNVVIR